MKKLTIFLLITLLLTTLTNATSAIRIEELRAEMNVMRYIMRHPETLKSWIVKQGGIVETDTDGITWHYLFKNAYGIEGYAVGEDDETIWWGTFYKGRIEDGWISAINGVWEIVNFTYQKLI